MLAVGTAKGSIMMLDPGSGSVRLKFQAHTPGFVEVTPDPGGNPGANLKSISHMCQPILVAFVWELTKETIHLPLGCLQGGSLRPNASGQIIPWDQTRQGLRHNLGTCNTRT